MRRSRSPASSYCTASGRDSSDWDVWAFKAELRLRFGTPCWGLEFFMAQQGKRFALTAICTRAVEGIGKNHHARQFARQGGQCRVIGDIAGGEDQRRLAAVQIGELALQQQMHMVVARDIARAAGTGADCAQGLLYRSQDRRMLPHAEIVVRTPHRDLGADAVIIGARKAAAAPLEIGEHAVPPLGAQRVEALFEVALVIHPGPLLVALTSAAGSY